MAWKFPTFNRKSNASAQSSRVKNTQDKQTAGTKVADKQTAQKRNDNKQTAKKQSAEKQNKPQAQVQARGKRISNMPITAFAALIVVILASIQLLSVFHTYALNLAQLNALRNQEAALIEQKEQLDRNIERWNDNAYVTAQARERLGFVFPGEKSVRVLGSQEIEKDSDGKQTKQQQSTSSATQDPWYSIMNLSIREADDPGTVQQGQ